jgi:hypothetical protein
MKNEEIYNIWKNFINNNKYKGYFKSNEYKWFNMFNNVEKYINENNKRPSKHDKNNDTKNLGMWIGTQQQNYINKKKGMKNVKIYDKWTEFINNPEYEKYFKSNEELWNEKFKNVIEYIDSNNKKPSSGDKNKDIVQLSIWISSQYLNYKNKEYLMENDEIYKKWTEFINDIKYKGYFETNEEIWINKLENVKKYIDENNKKPQNNDKDVIIKKMGKWVYTQSKTYKKKEHIMKNMEIYDKWTEFINNDKYKIYFKNNID